MGERRCIGLDSSGRMPCGLQDARASIPVPVAVGSTSQSRFTAFEAVFSTGPLSKASRSKSQNSAWPARRETPCGGSGPMRGEREVGSHRNRDALA
jgi:hypothetical protein